MLQYICVVGLVETLSGLLLLCDVVQHLVQNTKPRVRNVSHGMLEGPDNGV